MATIVYAFDLSKLLSFSFFPFRFEISVQILSEREGRSSLLTKLRRLVVFFVDLRQVLLLRA